MIDEVSLETSPLLRNENDENGPLDIRQKKYRKPTKTTQYVVLLCCFVLQILTMGNGFGLSVMYVEIIRVFDSTRSEASLVQSVYFTTMAGAGMVLAWIVTKLGPGLSSVLGGVIACVGFLLSGFAVNIAMMIVTAGLIAGFGMGLSYLTSFMAVSMVFHEDAGIPLIVITIGSGIGQVVMPFLYDLLIREYYWNGAFIIIGGILLNCSVCGVIMFTNRESFRSTGSKNNKGHSRIFSLDIVKDAVLMVILLCSFLLAVTGPLESWFLVDVMVGRGFEREVGTLFVSLIGVANLIGRMIGALIRTFCGWPSIYHWIYICPLVGLSHALIIYLYSYWWIFAAVMVNGLSYGCTIAQTPAIIYETAGKEKYLQAISVMNMLYGLGDFVGGFSGGFTNDLTGSYDLIFYIGLAISLFISVVTVILVIWLQLTGSTRYNNSRQ